MRVLPSTETEPVSLVFPLQTFTLHGKRRPANNLTCRSECDLSKSVYNLNIHLTDLIHMHPNTF